MVTNHKIDCSKILESSIYISIFFFGSFDASVQPDCHIVVNHIIWDIKGIVLWREELVAGKYFSVG